MAGGCPDYQGSSCSPLACGQSTQAWGLQLGDKNHSREKAGGTQATHLQKSVTWEENDPPSHGPRRGDGPPGQPAAIKDRINVKDDVQYVSMRKSLKVK